jgi:hypothetical protein
VLSCYTAAKGTVDSQRTIIQKNIADGSFLAGSPCLEMLFIIGVSLDFIVFVMLKLVEEFC